MIQIQTMNNTYNAIRDIERAIMPHPFDTPSEKTTYPRSCHKPTRLRAAPTFPFGQAQSSEEAHNTEPARPSDRRIQGYQLTVNTDAYNAQAAE